MAASTADMPGSGPLSTRLGVSSARHSRTSPVRHPDLPVVRRNRWRNRVKELPVNKPKKMTQQDAARIQSHTDRTGKNPSFKSRAQSVADSRAVKPGDRQGSQAGKK
jgi:hypothetical protein